MLRCVDVWPEVGFTGELCTRSVWGSARAPAHIVLRPPWMVLAGWVWRHQ